MEFINQFKLIEAIMSGSMPDAKKFLAEVDRDAVERSLKRSKEGFPKHFIFIDEPIEEANFARIPSRDKEKILRIYDRIKSNPVKSKKALPMLLEFREKYPNVPIIYNHIGLIYVQTDQLDLYFENLLETNRLFPDYLFAKTAMCDHYLNEGDVKKVDKVLEGKFEIYMHFPPSEKVFHVSAVRAFYSVVGSYFARRNKIARAIYCYFILEGAGSDHPVTEKVRNEIMAREIKNMGGKLSKNIR